MSRHVYRKCKSIQDRRETRTEIYTIIIYMYRKRGGEKERRCIHPTNLTQAPARFR